MSATAAKTELDDTLVICPHCGHSYQPEAADFSEAQRVEECDQCHRNFQRYDEFTVTHHTRAI